MSLDSSFLIKKWGTQRVAKNSMTACQLNSFISDPRQTFPLVYTGKFVYFHYVLLFSLLDLLVYLGFSSLVQFAKTNAI